MVVFMFTDYYLHWQVRRYLPYYAVFDIVKYICWVGSHCSTFVPAGARKVKANSASSANEDMGLGICVRPGLCRVVESKRSYTRLPSRW